MADTYTFLLLVIAFSAVSALPEPGRWETEKKFNNSQVFRFTKSVFKDTIVSLKFICDTKAVNQKLRVGWMLRYSPCSQEFQNVVGNEKEEHIIEAYFRAPDSLIYPDFGYTVIEYIKEENIEKLCNGNVMYLPDKTALKPTIAESGTNKLSEDETNNGTRKRRAVSPEKTVTRATTPKPATTVKKTETTKLVANVQKVESTKPVTAGKTSGTMSDKTSTDQESTVISTQKPAGQPVPMSEKVDEHHLAKIWKSGFYLLVLKIESTDVEVDVTVSVSMKSDTGFISAVEWPLLIFYGVMGLVYIFYGLMWLVMLACNWRDLMRIQYWIGAVIFLGMLEKAVFYSDYQSVATNGNSFTKGAVVFAEVVSCLKRSLARVIVIIVSHGFGIVKPRLGPTRNKVLAVGALYTVLATIEGCIRSLASKGDQSKELIYAAAPLAVLDACICYWVFYSLVQTLRQLRLRRNIVKLTLYRHFSNTLIFAVIASIIFIIWSVIQIKLKTCIKDWHDLWIDEAFWHLLFSIILLVIMILWRPSSNNQRYAFTPLLDRGDEDDDEDETPMNDAFEGMKMRGKANGSPKQKQNTIEDDLKWVEENIPSAISDKAEALLESDEEVMTAKYEMSKMQ